MKGFFLAMAAMGVALMSGCVTHVKVIDLTGDVRIDALRAIANGPARDKVLWEDRLAVADLNAGDFQGAKQNLDDVLLTLGGIYGKDASAKKARSYFVSENKKTFIGEPYERVMDYYYRGILYWMDGEPDNARACFRSGQIEDSSSEGEQYTADYVLLDYLDGLATAKLAGDGNDAFQRSQTLSRQFSKPPPYNLQANVLFFIEFGPGPKKFASGQYREELHLFTPASPVQSATVTVDNQTVDIGPYDDLGFQAATRGGRVMDHILGNKAVFKASTDIAGNASIFGGAVAASTGNQVGAEVGLGLIAAGIISKVVSAETRAAADTRNWNNLPHYLSFAALQLAPGAHTATIQFHDQSGGILPRLTKTFTLNIAAEKRDKVIYVSDHSATPQNL